MKTTEFMTFGNLIAFALPGAVAVRAVAYLSPSLRHAFAALEGATNEAAGPIFFVTVAALAAGVTLNTVRRAAFDALLNRLGRGRVTLDYSRLSEQNRERFNDALEGVYRPYEFTANMALALALVVVARVAWGPADAGLQSPLTLGIVALAATLTVIARSQLRASYQVLAKVLGMAVATGAGGGAPAAGMPAAGGSPREIPRAKEATNRPEGSKAGKDWPPE